VLLTRSRVRAKRDVDAEVRAAHDHERWHIDGEQRLAATEREHTLRQLAKIGKVRDRLADSRSKHLQTAERLSEKSSPEDYSGLRKALSSVHEIGQIDADLAREEVLLEERLQSVAVVAEPPSYAPDSPNSYYRDLSTVALARLGPEVDDPLARTVSSDVDQSPAAARSRLDQHARDVQLAVAKGDEYGRRCKAILNEHWREADPVAHRQRSERELRAFTTGGGGTATASTQAAAFVSPYFLMAQWAPFRSPIRTFADQCANFPIPPYGMEVYIPVFTGADKASLQTEGATVAETVPTAGLEGAKVETATGQLLLTKQFADRMNTGGGAFDTLVSEELNWRVDAEIGKYVINQALAGATVVSGNSAYTEAGLWEDLAKAREQLSDTAGTRLRATSMFTTTDLYGFVTRQVDKTTERPIWPPWYATA
jgi:hypothetical protein